MDTIISKIVPTEHRNPTVANSVSTSGGEAGGIQLIWNDEKYIVH